MLGAGDIAGDEIDGVPDLREPQWKMTVSKKSQAVIMVRELMT